jgi:TPR repeat protein
MKLALSLACLSMAALAAGMASPAAAQDEPAARLTSRSIDRQRLSVRALPAPPPVHRLSIGPLAAPADDAVSAPPADTTAGETVEALADRARRGDANANYRLGLRYLAGDGVTRDLVEAFARVRLAAAAGHPRAVSLFYFLGAKLTAEEHAQAFERAQQLRTK